MLTVPPGWGRDRELHGILSCVFEMTPSIRYLYLVKVARDRGSKSKSNKDITRS